MPQRQPFDVQTYIRDIQTRPCFICEMVARNPACTHEIVYEDDVAIAFLNKYPPLYGYVLVAPRQHREQVTGDFTLKEYLNLQQVIYRGVLQLSAEESSALVGCRLSLATK
jgi:diadenosine tetraphosphate (Ap4A) HIT family hydrolase